MALPLTPDILRAAYAFLSETPPFRFWNLPDADDVLFRVGKDPALRGWYLVERGKHVIAISRRCIGHTNNVLATMAHEMIHLYQRDTGIETPNAEHNRAFVRIAERVCRIHGWDPKLF